MLSNACCGYALFSGAVPEHSVWMLPRAAGYDSMQDAEHAVVKVLAKLQH